MKKRFWFLTVGVLVLAILAISNFPSNSGKQVNPQVVSNNLNTPKPSPKTSPSPFVIDQNSDLKFLNQTLTPDNFSSDYSNLKDLLK